MCESDKPLSKNKSAVRRYRWYHSLSPEEKLNRRVRENATARARYWKKKAEKEAEKKEAEGGSKEDA